ncbi:hypothetical protein CYY_008046 [Polysphondylium violaceum]|uniref:Follistatin-like domain-containing protein n=1 Tax=Polysphondylium violaceum TaxID=133409 RepID=A0A8J4UQG0_9MYCE|nr:hypothetical protein CYY_008046 [Polysphondylium violaceum]
MLSKYLLVILVTIALFAKLSSSNYVRPHSQNHHFQCESLSEDQCKQNHPKCRYLPFVSCCGTKKFFCLPDDGSGCGNAPLSCGKDPHTNAIYEIWSSCKPRGLEHYRPNNHTCESLACSSKGQGCEWVDPVPCLGTSCCPRHAQCTGDTHDDHHGGHHHRSACANVECPRDHRCQEISGVAYCVAVHPHQPNHHLPRPPHPFCEGHRCPRGKVCDIVNGRPTCISSHSGSDPRLCDLVQCPRGHYCQSYQGIANCIEFPDPICRATHCPAGHHCIALNNRPVCVRPPPDSLCYNATCPVSHTCSVINGIATCIQIPLPPNYHCKNVHCPAGTACHILNDLPACIKLPIPPPPNNCLSCANVRCAGVPCHMVENNCTANEPCCPYVPSCTATTSPTSTPTNPPIQPTSLRCGPSLTCHTGSVCMLDPPRCTSICDLVHCGSKSTCIVARGLPLCIPN